MSGYDNGQCWLLFTVGFVSDGWNNVINFDNTMWSDVSEVFDADDQDTDHKWDVACLLSNIIRDDRIYCLKICDDIDIFEDSDLSSLLK